MKRVLAINTFEVETRPMIVTLLRRLVKLQMVVGKAFVRVWILKDFIF